MLFDEALAHPGPLLAAWNLTPWQGTRTLALFALDGDGARPLAHTAVQDGQEEETKAPLRVRGIAIGEYDAFCDFVWVAEGERVTVWGPGWRVLEASGGTLALAEGGTLERAEMAAVCAYASDDYIERGVRARLRSGEEVTLVRDVSAAAGADPAYTRNELLYETGWAGAIARAVAAWAGVPYENLV